MSHSTIIQLKIAYDYLHLNLYSILLINRIWEVGDIVEIYT